MSHEDLSRSMEVEGSSNRSFGWVFTVVFLIVGAGPLLFGGGLRWWALVVAAGIGAGTILRPALLARPNRLWTQFGLLLGRVVSPVVMGLLFFVVFTPFGLVMRAFGHDPLRLKRNPEASTYWVERAPPGPPPESMRNQF